LATIVFEFVTKKSGQQNAIIAQLQLQKLEALRLDLLNMMMCGIELSTVTDDVNEQTPDLNTEGAASTSHQPPPAKIQKRDSDSVLYGSYDRRRKSDHSDLTTAALVKKYLDFVKSLNADTAEPWAAVRNNKTFERL